MCATLPYIPQTRLLQVSMDAWIIKLFSSCSLEFLEAVNAELIACSYAPGISGFRVPGLAQRMLLFA